MRRSEYRKVKSMALSRAILLTDTVSGISGFEKNEKHLFALFGERVYDTEKFLNMFKRSVKWELLLKTWRDGKDIFNTLQNTGITEDMFHKMLEMELHFSKEVTVERSEMTQLAKKTVSLYEMELLNEILFNTNFFPPGSDVTGNKDSSSTYIYYSIYCVYKYDGYRYLTDRSARIAYGDRKPVRLTYKVLYEILEEHDPNFTSKSFFTEFRQHIPNLCNESLHDGVLNEKRVHREVIERMINKYKIDGDKTKMLGWLRKIVDLLRHCDWIKVPYNPEPGIESVVTDVSKNPQERVSHATEYKGEVMPHGRNPLLAVDPEDSSKVMECSPNPNALTTCDLFGGRGELWKQGPNQAADMLLYHFDQDTHSCWVYLIKRKMDVSDPMFERYATPGGFVERGESPRETAIREFSEEVWDVSETTNETERQEEMNVEKKKNRNLYNHPYRYLFRGYGHDWRSTIEAWNETVCVAIEIKNPDKFKLMKSSTDEASDGNWINIGRIDLDEYGYMFNEKEIEYLKLSLNGASETRESMLKSPRMTLLMIALTNVEKAENSRLDEITKKKNGLRKKLKANPKSTKDDYKKIANEERKEKSEVKIKSADECKRIKTDFLETSNYMTSIGVLQLDECLAIRKEREANKLRHLVQKFDENKVDTFRLFAAHAFFIRNLVRYVLLPEKRA